LQFFTTIAAINERVDLPKNWHLLQQEFLSLPVFFFNAKESSRIIARGQPVGQVNKGGTRFDTLYLSLYRKKICTAFENCKNR
jgi:hypothetical protein